MKKFLSLLLAVVMLLGCASFASAEATDELSGKLVIWSAGDELGRFQESFKALHPNVEIEYVTISSDFLLKLEPALASGQGPDIFADESAYVRYLVNSDYWEDLRQEPYQVEQYLDSIWPYVYSVGTDNAGAVKALSWQMCPGSIIYRTDLAEKYFGVSTVEDASKLFADYDTMMANAAKLKESDVKMFASWYDLYNVAIYDRSNPWVVDGKFMLDDNIVKFFDVVKTIAENGYDLNTDSWSSEWMAGVEQDDVFCYVIPSWGYQFVIKPNANLTKGKWGLCEANVPYLNGGTWAGISKDSQNKELAWEYLKFSCLDKDAAMAYGAEYGEYVANKEADAELAKGAGEEVLGGQNCFEFYGTQMEKVSECLLTEYDEQIDIACKNAIKAYAYDGVSLEDALQQFKDDVLNAYPDLIVE